MALINRSKLNARKAVFRKRRDQLGFIGAVRSKEGAIDLASIMVGVIIIGVIAGVIAATVFAVIPWAQNKAAAQALDPVNQAESVSFAQSTDSGAGVYENYTDLQTKDGAGQPGGLLQASKSVDIATTGTGSVKGDAHYLAVSLSSTGEIFFTTDDKPATPTMAANLAELQTDIASLPNFATVTAAVTAGAITLTAPTV